MYDRLFLTLFRDEQVDLVSAHVPSGHNEIHDFMCMKMEHFHRISTARYQPELRARFLFDELAMQCCIDQVDLA